MPIFSSNIYSLPFSSAWRKKKEKEAKPMKRKILTSLFTLFLCAVSVLPAQAAFCRRCSCSPADIRCPSWPFCSATSDSSDASDTPGTPDTPETPDTPDAPDSDAAAQQPDVSAYAGQILSLVNAERAANGLSALTLSDTLGRYASVKAQDMHDAGYFDHTSPTYGSPFEMMRSFGISYRYAGENIAMGYSSPAAVMAAWMNSASHRANILSENFTTLGVGYVASGGYWVQWFIG